jgi:hypothetical protein
MDCPCKPWVNYVLTEMHGLHEDVPSLYATGCAGSDFTTCLPVPWRGQGPLVRSKQAVFKVFDFGRIGVKTSLATAVESVRSIRAGSNLDCWSF